MHNRRFKRRRGVEAKRRRGAEVSGGPKVAYYYLRCYSFLDVSQTDYYFLYV